MDVCFGGRCSSDVASLPFPILIVFRSLSWTEGGHQTDGVPRRALVSIVIRPRESGFAFDVLSSQKYARIFRRVSRVRTRLLLAARRWGQSLAGSGGNGRNVLLSELPVVHCASPESLQVRDAGFMCRCAVLC